jgi:hypothetical protein
MQSKTTLWGAQCGFWKRQFCRNDWRSTHELVYPPTLLHKYAIPMFRRDGSRHFVASFFQLPLKRYCYVSLLRLLTLGPWPHGE